LGRTPDIACGTELSVDVTLNEQRHITGVFAGDLLAHQTGCEFVRRSAM
jgi:nickel-dependent lactate racemase